jgi:protein AroM
MRTTTRIGAMTIGQSPRVDIVPEFRRAIGFDVEIEERGALDGLSLDEVKKLAPEADDYVLVTRMQDGTEVKIAERHILDRLRRHAHDLERQQVALIVLFCTGEFPEMAADTLLITPDRLLEHAVRGILKRGSLAVVAPSEDQIEMMKKKWEGPGLRLVVDSVSPYTAPEESYVRVATSIKEQSPDIVVLDCMGFGTEVKGIFRQVIGKPVILPRTLLGRTVAELIEVSE